MTTVFESILQLLEESKVAFKHIQHQPTYTCEESARIRGEGIAMGAKAMLMKLDDVYALFVLSAAKRIDSKKVKALLRYRSMRFASDKELFEQTALLPGSVPPFGKPILPFDLYVDISIQDLSSVAFNAGSLSNSIVMKSADYLNLCKGTLCSFSK